MTGYQLYYNFAFKNDRLSNVRMPSESDWQAYKKNYKDIADIDQKILQLKSIIRSMIVLQNQMINLSEMGNHINDCEVEFVDDIAKENS